MLGGNFCFLLLLFLKNKKAKVYVFFRGFLVHQSEADLQELKMTPSIREVQQFKVKKCWKMTSYLAALKVNGFS